MQGRESVKILHYQDNEFTIFDSGPARGVKGSVLIGKRDGAPNFCMRFFQVSPGGFTVRHTHDWEHEIFIHEGEGAVLRNGELVPVKAGTAIFIPGGEEHQIQNTGNGPLLFVCLIPAGPPEL